MEKQADFKTTFCSLFLDVRLYIKVVFGFRKLKKAVLAKFFLFVCDTENKFAKRDVAFRY